MIIVGRSPLTQITEANCSRKQLLLTACYGQRTVSAVVKGSNPSFVDGSPHGKDSKFTFSAGQTLHILDGKYPHSLHITEKDESKPVSTKRKREISDYFTTVKSSKKDGAD